jgi:hypothetical protein
MSSSICGSCKLERMPVINTATSKEEVASLSCQNVRSVP